MPKEYLAEVPVYTFNEATGLIDATVWEVTDSGKRKAVRSYTIPIHIAYKNLQGMRGALAEFEAWNEARQQSGNVTNMDGSDGDH